MCAATPAARAGDRLRRGFMLIEGAAGDYAGSRMIAGTLAVGGAAGALPGYLMNRGTILLAGRRRALAPTFLDCGVYELVAARAARDSHRELQPPRSARRFAGRCGATPAISPRSGKGEVFTPPG